MCLIDWFVQNVIEPMFVFGINALVVFQLRHEFVYIAEWCVLQSGNVWNVFILPVIILRHRYFRLFPIVNFVKLLILIIVLLVVILALIDLSCIRQVQILLFIYGLLRGERPLVPIRFDSLFPDVFYAFDGGAAELVAPAPGLLFPFCLDSQFILLVGLFTRLFP